MPRSNEPIPVHGLPTQGEEAEMSAFIVFGSPERRCLGAAMQMREHSIGSSFVLRITDEENAERAQHIQELRGILERFGDVKDCPTSHADPLAGIQAVVQEVSALVEASTRAGITLDISTFPKNSLLLMLRALDQWGLTKYLRLVYTEPADYKQSLDEPLSYGIKGVKIVPTFSAPYKPQEELCLIVFLGYERDRALGLVESIQPHRTIGVIARPAYRPEWEGRSEQINAALLASLDSSDIFYVDSRNPLHSHRLLERLAVSESVAGPNLYISPLGTKPQTIGIYSFVRKHRTFASVVYAAPIAHSHQYITEGLGPTWILPSVEID